MYYYGARYYDARLSRWVSADPILSSYLDGKPSGGVYNAINNDLYHYGHHNPIKYIDPDGRYVADSIVKAGQNAVKGLLGIQKPALSIANIARSAVKSIIKEYNTTNVACKPIRDKHAYIASWYIRSKNFNPPNALHGGIDIGGVAVGTSIYPMYYGKVISSRYSESYGWNVQIRNYTGPYKNYITTYAHMYKRPYVTTGNIVNVNTILGGVGGTPFINNGEFKFSPHLHLDIAPTTPSRRQDRINLDKVFMELYK